MIAKARLASIAESIWNPYKNFSSNFIPANWTPKPFLQPLDAAFQPPEAAIRTPKACFWTLNKILIYLAFLAFSDSLHTINTQKKKPR